MPQLNDHARWKAQFVDTVNLFSRLSLLYKHKIRIDGCVAVTLDDSETIVVNISDATKGLNATAIYPSLRVQGKDGMSYVLLKDDGKQKSASTSNTNTSSSNNSLPVLPDPKASAISSIKSPSIIKAAAASKGTAHLVAIPSSFGIKTITPIKPGTKGPVLVVRPRSSGSVNQLQSLITGKQHLVNPASGQQSLCSVSSPAASSPATIVNIANKVSTLTSAGVEAGDMANMQNVLQSRNNPHLQLQVNGPSKDIKSEPQSDETYGKACTSKDMTNQINIQCVVKLKKVTDKENTSLQLSPRAMTRSSSRTEMKDTSETKLQQLNKRKNSSVTPVPSIDTPATDTCPITLPSEEDGQNNGTKKRRSTRLKSGLDDVAPIEAQCPNTTTADNSETDQPTEISLQDTSVSSSIRQLADPINVGYTSDDSESTASDDTNTTTDTEDVLTLFTCSEKFTQECAKKSDKIESASVAIRADLDKMNKDNTKDIRKSFKKAMTSYEHVKKEFENAKARGSHDIGKMEKKLDVKFEALLNEFAGLKKNMNSQHGKSTKGKTLLKHKKMGQDCNTKSNSDKKLHGLLHPGAKVKKDRSHSAMHRESRTCGECVPCKRSEDCKKCIFCMDKAKYGGKNTLRQKCIKKQCLNKGKFAKLPGKMFDVKKTG